jgi:hypothetical protein
MKGFGFEEQEIKESVSIFLTKDDNIRIYRKRVKIIIFIKYIVD